jgi:hypothetical protein
MSAAADARVKGAGVRELFRWYGERHGRARMVEHFARLAPDEQALFDAGDPHFGILPSTWYPAPVLHKILDGLDASLTRPEREALLRDGAREALRVGLTGFYKLLFETMMTPERYAARAQTLFSRYFTPGVMTKIVEAPNQHLSVVEGWTGHHPMLCDVLIHSAEVVYGRMGCRDISSQKIACVGDGASDCRFRIRWRA